jgi:hypothetical protein
VEYSLYDLLEVAPSASSDQIDDARGRALALMTEEYSRETGVRREHVDAAWRVLRDPRTREQYDRFRDAGTAPSIELLVGGDTDFAILSQLLNDWESNPTPPLPPTVSEVTNWAIPPSNAGGPVEKKSRHRRRAEREMELLIGNGGIRPPSSVARILAAVVGPPFAIAIVVGGYIVAKGQTVPVPLYVGGCARLTETGTVTKGVDCTNKPDVRIAGAFQNPNLCRSDLRIPMEGQPGWVWCADRIPAAP